MKIREKTHLTKMKKRVDCKRINQCYSHILYISSIIGQSVMYSLRIWLWHCRNILGWTRYWVSMIDFRFHNMPNMPLQWSQSDAGFYRNHLEYDLSTCFNRIISKKNNFSPCTKNVFRKGLHTKCQYKFPTDYNMVYK